jgi:hypothetical protein
MAEQIGCLQWFRHLTGTLQVGGGLRDMLLAVGSQSVQKG